MANHKKFTLEATTESMVKRCVSIDVMRSLRLRGRPHLRVVLNSGWVTDRPLFIGCTSNKLAAKKLVREFLAYAEVGNLHKYAETIGF